ncbi:hypothetical protein NLJ89_g6208 [Agrocybe chaxingu]|uniref:Spt20-like SEP domain-containing protein n=1 Tax=Agrocybe chaxingu TaxID=84603 RepID=A0A9W8K6V2_9AGAR|nr:hypothetical protein NLJ89_g6208 [Agrocybe chaxingu]
MAGYNRTRYVEQLLEKTESLPASFTVHLHPEHWVLNNGSKFLYNHQLASLLDDIRAHRIPVDFLELFDAARVPFYDGCMVVELLDYRPQRSKEPALKTPERTRVVLHPNSETLWADICSLNQKNGKKWTDMDALEVEAKLLLATSQPLCLDPNPHLTRIVNHVLRVSTPSMPLSLKRKASALEAEEDGPEKAKRERLLGFMAPRDNRLHAPSYRLLDAHNVIRQKEAEQAASGQGPQPGNQYMNVVPPSDQAVQPSQTQLQPQPPAAPSTPAPAVAAPSPSDSADKRSQKPKKIDTPQQFNVAYRPNGTPTPDR